MIYRWRFALDNGQALDYESEQDRVNCAEGMLGPLLLTDGRRVTFNQSNLVFVEMQEVPESKNGND